MGINLILWTSIIWLPLLLYFTLGNETKFKKNIAVGVTLPYEGRSDTEVQTVLKKFKKELLWVCLGLIIVAIPCIFITNFGAQFTIWLVWIDLTVVLPFIPYVRCNRKLNRLKHNRGWDNKGNGSIGDLKIAAEPIKWLSPWLFVLPMLLSLIPLFFNPSLWVLYVIDAAMVLLCWLGYRYLYRNKAEVVDTDTAVTEALTRIRRYNWGKCWLWCAWAMTALNLTAWLTQGHVWLMMISILAISFAIVAATLGVEFRTRRMQERLTVNSGIDFYVDDDAKWLWGIFYYDPNDSRLLINNRVGLNSTVNMAKPAGKIFMGLTAILLLAMPLLGVWISTEDSAAVTLRITETSIIAEHNTSHYVIDLNDIADIQLLDELPDISRIAGTGLNNVQKGKYNSEWGALTVCLNPQKGPYLLIELEDSSLYLVGSNDSAETRKIYQDLSE